MATLAGITVRYLEMIEAGTKTPTLHVLRKIAKVLAEEGITVARRTVAKYREAMNIPSSSERRVREAR